MKLSGSRIVWAAASFLAMLLIVNNLSDDARTVVLPLILLAIFVRSAIKAPPIAIAILLYFSMILGSWFIVAAAPVTMLLARRYQRQRLQLEPSAVHIRRTVILAVGALVASLPFIAASLGPWSARSQSSASRSASPLVPQRGRGEEGALQRFARWLGFGPDPGGQPGQFEPLQPVPVQPRPQQPDESFNWWILVAVLVILAFAVLAWWLWRRRKPAIGPEYSPAAAQPLARLEAVGESIGRPRAPFEGAITYGRELARRTGDARLAAAGPLVSSQVYESAFVNPGEVDANLRGIESSPPPPPPRPSFGERLTSWVDRFRFSPRSVLLALLFVAAIVIVGWVVVPRLGDLESDRFESGLAGLEQLQVVPLAAEHIDHDGVRGA